MALPSRRLLLGVGAVVVVIVVAVVVLATNLSGGSAGCATYPVAVREAYAKAMHDISGSASGPVLADDLGNAASLANSAAASAAQMTARNALFAMASDLDEAHADASAGKKLTSALMQRLTADGNALPRSCP